MEEYCLSIMLDKVRKLLVTGSIVQFAFFIEIM